MINLICGPRGTGKTEKIITSANSASEVCRGSIIFITDTSEYSRSIKHSIRFINVKEYLKVNEVNFLGFIAGIVASNSDIEKIYVDGLARMLKVELKDLEDLITEIDIMSDKLKLDFIISVTADSIPASLKKYVK